MKKGSAELVILSIVEARARHGYEISKLIEERSAGRMKFHIASLYPLLYRLEERGWLQGRWVEKAGQRRRKPVANWSAPRRANTPPVTMCTSTGRGDAKNRALAGVIGAPPVSSTRR